MDNLVLDDDVFSNLQMQCTKSSIAIFFAVWHIWKLFFFFQKGLLKNPMRTSTMFGGKGVSVCSDCGMTFSGVEQDEWDR